MSLHIIYIVFLLSAMLLLDRINSDPEFRHQFHTMCINVGVDPLASNKGFWANMLGVGDFYFELG